jgi:hypothetical protein
MFAGIKTITDQFFKELDKQPGWAPLLATIYTYIWFTHPFSMLWDNINRQLGTYMELPVELLAVLITALAYTLGDAIDTVIFKKKENGVRKNRFSHEGYKSAQREAQKALGVEDGSYAISLKLAAAAEKERRRKSIHFWNEAAKFLRGLAAALVFLAIFWVSQKRYFFALIAVLEAGLLLPLYVILKFRHIQKLYELIPDLVELEKPPRATLKAQPENYFQVKDLDDDIRLFFWDGDFVSAGKRTQDQLIGA